MLLLPNRPRSTRCTETSSERVSQEPEDLLGDLTEAIARVLVRQGITAEEFLTVARRSYILATAELATPRGKTANVTRISSATGLSRKEVAAILRGSAISRGSSSSVLRRRALRVARGWLTDRRFLNDKKRPTLLTVGRAGTFHTLVALYGAGESAASILSILESLHVVECVRGKVRLLGDKVTTIGREGLPRRFGRQIADAVRAIDDDLNDATGIPKSRYRELSGLTPDEVALFRKMYLSRISALVESIDDWVEMQRRLRGGRRATSRRRCRLSLGVYLSTQD